jgi:hypothetical protein
MSHRFKKAGKSQTSDALGAELADLRALFQQAPGYMAVLRGRDHVLPVRPAPVPEGLRRWTGLGRGPVGPRPLRVLRARRRDSRGVAVPDRRTRILAMDDGPNQDAIFF